jgi:LEA14-like dessication related protein
MNITPKLRNGLIIGGILVAFTSLAVYMKKQYNLIKESCYTISGGIINSLALDSVKITLFFKFVNDSDITIKLSDMNFNIYVNKMFVTKIVRSQEQTVLSKANTIIRLDFDFNPKDLLRAGITNIEPIIYDKEKLVISIKGTFSAQTGIIKLKKFPIQEDITLKELMTPSSKEKKC